MELIKASGAVSSSGGLNPPPSPRLCFLILCMCVCVCVCVWASDHVCICAGGEGCINT